MAFLYAENSEFHSIEPTLLKRGMAGRLGFDILPVRKFAQAKVRWNQKDNYSGLQHLRGLDGRPTRVSRIGSKTLEYSPGVFGEFVDITETELTERAGDFDPITTPISIADLVAEADDQLINRENDRMENTIWTVLTTGVIKILIDGNDGTQVGYSESYPVQQYTAPISWSNLTGSTPIQNWQSVQQLGFAAGISVDFGAGATAYANNVTWNRMLNNTNAADFGGRRNAAGATLNNLPGMIGYLQAQNLPKAIAYDAGYVPVKNGTFKKYIPDGIIVVIGQRPSGVKPGYYAQTRNISNGGQPGSYRYVKDRANGVGAEKRTPANIEVHRGHNGGVAIEYPGSVLIMNV